MLWSGLPWNARPIGCHRIPAARIVTSGIEWIGPGAHRTFTIPGACAPCEVLADPHAVHASSMFRWADWQSAAGFDESLPALEHADFWLSLLARGGAIVVENAPLLRRRVHAAALYKRTWLTPDYRRALEALFDRHSAGRIGGGGPRPGAQRAARPERALWSMRMTASGCRKSSTRRLN